MRRRGWLVGLAALAALLLWWLVPGGGAGVLLGAQAPALFTAAQAEQGRRVAAHKCTACHGKNLEGKLGPQLAGVGFAARWAGKGAEELGRFIQARMPLTRPGSLKAAETLSLLAFILQANGYPAGEQELSEAALRGITFAGGSGDDRDPPGY